MVNTYLANDTNSHTNKNNTAPRSMLNKIFKNKKTVNKSTSLPFPTIFIN